MANVIMDTLERRWNAICKILFREEIGPMKDYVPWLRRYNEPITYRKSSVSGKEIAYAIDAYSEGSKWISFEEIDFGKRFEPLDLNEIKDIDSLVEALSDRFYYTGNVILGNSGEVEKSSNISDSFYMHETGKLADSKYVAYSTLGRLNEDCFGCNGIGESQFLIKCHETFRDKRCLELWMGQNSSDCFYVHQLADCSDCMFSFNLKSKRHAIGNLVLEKAKYEAIKAQLLSEMAAMLKNDKKLPSLVDIVAKSRYEKPKLASGREEGQKTDMAPIETAFEKTFKLLLGAKPEGPVDVYSEWLKRNVRRQEKCSSAISGRPVYRWDYADYFNLPNDRLITHIEAQKFGEQVKLSEAEIGSISLGNAYERLGKIAFFTPEYWEGTNTNVIECAAPTDTANAYRCSPILYSKYCAYSFWPRSSQYVFGSGALLDSEFCLNCYHSVKLRRCFEMDSCRDCSDSMFCHNCENVHDSMFCFNAKNLKYAVGNVEIGKGEYLRLKKIVLEEIAEKLGKGRKLALDIYNIGARK